MIARHSAAGPLVISVSLAALLMGCAATPLGPTVQAMPGPGKTFDAFQSDNNSCKAFAGDQVKGQADAANQRAAGTVALTTLLGAGLGAAVGGSVGEAGNGAAIGAASGAATGSVVRRGRRRERPGHDPATIRQRVLAMHVCQGRASAGLRAGRRGSARGPRAGSAGAVQPGRADPARVPARLG